MNRATAAQSRPVDLVKAFETASLEAGDFDHAAHIYVAWHYVRERGLAEAVARFTRGIRRLTRKLGVSAKYHETITWFYLIKIAERCTAQPGLDWQAFKAANPELFARHPALIERYYSPSLLASETARRMFVLPDL